MATFRNTVTIAAPPEMSSRSSPMPLSMLIRAERENLHRISTASPYRLLATALVSVSVTAYRASLAA
jgi:hypothetical protein